MRRPRHASAASPATSTSTPTSTAENAFHAAAARQTPIVLPQVSTPIDKSAEP